MTRLVPRQHVVQLAGVDCRISLPHSQPVSLLQQAKPAAHLQDAPGALKRFTLHAAHHPDDAFANVEHDWAVERRVFDAAAQFTQIVLVVGYKATV